MSARRVKIAAPRAGFGLRRQRPFERDDGVGELAVPFQRAPEIRQEAAVGRPADAGAACSIDVEYKSGPSKAADLDPKVTSASGEVSWTWLVGSRTTPGDWPVTVTCTLNGASSTDQKLLTVIDTGKSG